MPTPHYPDPVLLERSEITFPIPEDPTAQEIVETWRVNASVKTTNGGDYLPDALDAAHPDNTNFPDFILTEDRPIRRNEQHVTFQLRYNTVPAARDELDQIPFVFPGIADDGFGFGTSRPPVDDFIRARIRWEYFLDPRPFPLAVTGATSTASTDVIAASGHAYQNGDRLTFISGTTFTGLTAGTTYFARDVVAGVSFKLAATAGGSAVDITADGTDGVFDRGIPVLERQKFVEATSGYEINYVINAGWGTYGSTPTKATYLGWIAARTEMVAENSQLTRYRGNLWARRTPYVQAA